MKFLVFPVLLAALASCSSPQEVARDNASSVLARTIASAGSEEALNEDYEKMLKSTEPEKQIGHYFGYLLGIYYRTESLMRDYDSRLEKMVTNKAEHDGKDLMTDPAYAELVGAWIIRNRQIDKISYLYLRNYIAVVGRANDQSYTNEERARDLRIKKSFMQSIARYGKTERVAMQNLLIHLGEVAKEAHEQLNAPAENADLSALGQHVFKNVNEQTSAYIADQKASRQKMKKAEMDTDLEKEFLEITPLVQAHLQEQFQTREPQAAGDVVPSATAKGNLTGNTFREGRWALTYDDGPNATHTSAILDNLTAHGMKTSFFWLSSLTPRFPTLVGRTKSLGMAMGNHSHSHANLPKQGQANLNREIVQSTATHASVFGYKPTYFRCPYGACGGNGSNIRQMIANQGMVHIFWNVDSLDWQDKNPASIVVRVKRAMAVAKKGILLFHDIHPQTVKATNTLMNEWAPQVKAGSMRLITIPQAIQELNSESGMQ